MHKFLVGLYFTVLHICAIPRDYCYCLWHGLHYDLTWIFRGLPYIQVRRGSRILIGSRFTACSSSRWNSIGVPHRAILKTVQPGAILRIGDDVGVSGCVISAARQITIGNHVLIGSGALIVDSDAHPFNPVARRSDVIGTCRPVSIEDDVFIGARAIILKGVTVGHGSIIGAGAVVAHDIPPFVIAAGNPARIIREIERNKA